MRIYCAVKDSVLVKNILDGEVDWECVKEVLGWVVDTDAGTIALPENNIQELRNLLEILTTQRRMGRKDLERLVGNLRSMHLSVLGEVAHLYHIQRALAQAGTDKAWLSPDFYRDIADWRMLTEQTASQPTHLAKIIRRKPTHLGFFNASGLGGGGVWLDPPSLGKDLVWRHPWPEDIISNLVSSKKREGTITNSDMELVGLVLYEATLLAAEPDSSLAAPNSGSDNTPTVSWITKEAPTINPMVAGLLRIRTLIR